GTPMGDRNKHYIMRNLEFDYDQAFTGKVEPGDPLWLHPMTSAAENFSDGFDTRYLLSFGPFKIDPGETLPLSFAYVGGERLHVDPTNGADHLDFPAGNYQPEKFYENLNFEDLTTNARWASWIYDNPGVDTDGDGYQGKFVVCVPILTIDTITNGSDTAYDTLEYVADTTYITGDGVPDFEGAKPPSRPKMWVYPSPGSILIRFNGYDSETTPDQFLRVSGEDPLDFEGYRVYLSRDQRETSFSLQASYDIEDYNKYVYAPDGLSSNPWRLFDTPYTLEEARAAYGDPSNPKAFHPLDYQRNNPLAVGDSTFFFQIQDYNAYRFGIDTPIKKRYPDALPPTDSGFPGDTTKDGYFKYYEYEYLIEDVLPTVRYWINVTAFDYGSPASGLPSLETSKTVGAIEVYARATAEAAKEAKLPIYTYPNPYRMDADYRGSFHEGDETQEFAEGGRADDRVRSVNFANVPADCIIRIYSLDGDLVREIEHHEDPTSPVSGHAEWNLITRNTQLAVSGLYYWSVEDLTTGEVEIGKLALIM
ncbi:MAG: hypothetical protein P1R58_12485, partial [bacterium]|nr:hypothetical protein [bacterium]